MDKYQNQRLDHPRQQGSAAKGRVVLDAGKLAWVGLMTLGSILAVVLVTPGAMIMAAVLTLATLCLGHSLGMHRRLIHDSFSCSKPLTYTLVHLGTIVGLAGPFGMLRTHDIRDWAQRQSHCHDYFAHRSPWHRDCYWQILCRIELDSEPALEIEADIADDPGYQWLERWWRWQQLPWAIALWLVGGWSWVLWGICVRVLVSHLGHWGVGYCAHNQGHQRWLVKGAAVQGYNVGWVSLLTMGECWHNNHHAFPGSAKMGLEPGQWDPGWWLLRALAQAGWVWDLQTPERLAPRSELQAATSALATYPTSTIGSLLESRCLEYSHTANATRP